MNRLDFTEENINKLRYTNRTIQSENKKKSWKKKRTEHQLVSCGTSGGNINVIQDQTSVKEKANIFEEIMVAIFQI